MQGPNAMQGYEMHNMQGFIGMHNMQGLIEMYNMQGLPQGCACTAVPCNSPRCNSVWNTLHLMN